MELLYALGGVVTAYAGFLVGGGLWQNFASESVTSQEQLERIVGEEADKLGLDKSKIIAEFYDKGHKNYGKIRGARSTVLHFDLDRDEFVSGDEVEDKRIGLINLLEIKEGWGANRGAVRHESYHLDKHFPRTKGIVQMMKWFYQEPAAILYATTGIKTV